MTMTRIKPQGLVTANGIEYFSTPTWTTGVNTYNLNNGYVFYHSTTPTANWTADFTNVPTNASMIVNQAGSPAYGGLVIEVKIAAQIGTTAYYPNAVRIDGAAQTVVGATATAGVSKFNVWTYHLWRRSSDSTWFKVILKSIEAF